MAAALLSIVTYNWLFTGTVLGFLASAALVISAALPEPAAPAAPPAQGAYARAATGTRLFLAVPELRALLALNLAVAAAGAMVTVNPSSTCARSWDCRRVPCRWRSARTARGR